MIVFRITMNVIPEKQLEIKQTLLSMIEPTTKEAGCLSNGVFSDIEDKCRFSLLQEWETREDLDHHLTSQSFGALLGTKALLIEPIGIQILTVSQSEGMDAIRSVRKKKSVISPTDG